MALLGVSLRCEIVGLKNSKTKIRRKYKKYCCVVLSDWIIFVFMHL